MHVLPADGDGQHLRLEPHAPAGRTGARRHVPLDLRLDHLRTRLAVATLQVRHHPLEGGAEGVLRALPGRVEHADPFALVPVEEDLAGELRQVPHRLVRREPVVRCDRFDDLAEPRVGDRHAAPGQHGALADREVLVGEDAVRVDLEAAPEARAVRAGAVWRVEAEVARCRLLEAAAVLGARVPLAEEAVRPAGALIGQVHEQRPVREAQGGLDGVRHPRGIRSLPVRVAGSPVADHQPIDHDIDAVLVLLVEGDLLVEILQLPVHANADEPGLLRAGQHLLVLALAVAHERRHDHQPGVSREVVELVDDLLHRLPRDLAPADGAVHAADASEEEAEVVVDLGDRADRGSRVPRRALLIDADRRGEAVDLVDVRLLHLAQELPRVGRERLDVPALSLRVDRVEGEAGLA